MSCIPRFAVLSFLIFSRCFLSSAAFLISALKSSGSSPVSLCSASTLVILLPSIVFVNGTPYWSRSIVPIWLAVLPCFASFTISISSSFVSSLAQLFFVGVSGLLLRDFPFALLCIFAIVF